MSFQVYRNSKRLKQNRFVVILGLGRGKSQAHVHVPEMVEQSASIFYRELWKCY